MTIAEAKQILPSYLKITEIYSGTYDLHYVKFWGVVDIVVGVIYVEGSDITSISIYKQYKSYIADNSSIIYKLKANNITLNYI